MAEIRRGRVPDDPGDQNARQLRALGLDNLHGFANRRTGGDHVIHQHYPALQRATDQIAAFAMGFASLRLKQ